MKEKEANMATARDYSDPNGCVFIAPFTDAEEELQWVENARSRESDHDSSKETMA